MPSPDIYYFNASNDEALFSDSFSYSPPLFIQKFEEDLSVIPFLLSKPDDIILTHEKIDNTYISMIERLNLPKVQFIAKSDFFKEKIYKNGANSIKPWGWSRSTHILFKDVKKYCSENYQNSPAGNWNEKYRYLSSRYFSIEILADLINSGIYDIVKKEEMPVIIKNAEDVKKVISFNQSIIFKTPWSCSGRGIRIINNNVEDYSKTKWLTDNIKRYGGLVAEKYYKRLSDFSFLFSCHDGIIKPLCISSFITDEEGKYKGSYIHYSPNETINSFLHKNNNDEIIPNKIIESLYSKNFHKYYEGWFGVDAMIVEDNGKILIHPCVEINCRYTIGHLAFVLRKYVSATKAILITGLIEDYLKQNEGKKELFILNDKIAGGYGLLTPQNENTKFAMWIESDN